MIEKLLEAKSATGTDRSRLLRSQRRRASNQRGAGLAIVDGTEESNISNTFLSFCLFPVHGVRQFQLYYRDNSVGWTKQTSGQVLVATGQQVFPRSSSSCIPEDRKSRCRLRIQSAQTMADRNLTSLSHTLRFYEPIGEVNLRTPFAVRPLTGGTI